MGLGGGAGCEIKQDGESHTCSEDVVCVCLCIDGALFLRYEEGYRGDWTLCVVKGEGADEGVGMIGTVIVVAGEF